jgi:hypothetical protein
VRFFYWAVIQKFLGFLIKSFSSSKVKLKYIPHNGHYRIRDLGGSSPVQEDGNWEKGWREAGEHTIIPGQETIYWLMYVSYTLYAKPLGL